MFARVTSGTVQPSKRDEAVKLNRDTIMPAAKKQKGFKAYYSLSNRDTGKAMTISIWETEADMKAAETSGYYREQLAKVAPLMAGPTTMEHYEVTTQG
jgi:heme-degrading monooxygenase HmoA